MSATEDAARNARRAAALKDNLKRRKAQARARAAPPQAQAGLMVRCEPDPLAGEPRTIEGNPDTGPNAAKKR